MSSTTTDSNSNPIGVPPTTNVTVSTVSLDIVGNSSHEVFVTGQFSADGSGATGGIVVASILVDSNLSLNTQINNLEGNSGTILSLSGVVSLTPGRHQVDLTAFAENVQFASAHHRLLSVIDLDAGPRCKGIFVDVTAPRFGARGDSVTDDRNAIQAAIDSLPPTGGSVYFPLINCAPTTYILGTPGVPTPPLRYPSNVTFLGDYLPGVGRSTLKLCDDFRQIIFGAAISPTTLWQSCVFGPASAARFWGPYGPNVPNQVTNVAFRDLAIDGNRDNQPLLFTKSNHGLVPDPAATPGGTAVAGASTLLAGTYQFFLTYSDVNGIETNVQNGTYLALAVADGQLARVNLPPTPAGAQQLYVYVSKSEKDAYGFDLVYERQGPFAIPGGGTIDITSHVLGAFYPPGNGIHVSPGESATGAISVDSNTAPGTSPTSNIVVDNCDIGNMASDCLTIVGFAQNICINSCNLHNTGLNGMSTAADGISGLYVTDTAFFDCSVGTDFENDKITLVRYLRCSFNKCGPGMSIGTTDTVHTSDFVIDTCRFGDVSPNTTNMQVIMIDTLGRADSIHIKNCYFGYAISYPMVITAAGGGTIQDCFFDQTARPHAYNPGQFYALDAAQLRFDGVQSSVGDIGPAGSNWQVLGCSFKPFANASFATSFPCMDAINGAKNVYVSGCVYVHNDSQGGPLPLNILFNSDVLGGLANHRFAGNYGVLGEAYVAAVGYSVGSADTSITVVFPTAQTTSQYEVCPLFGWDSGNWWVTAKTTTGYTLHWKNAPGGDTRLPITVRDAQA